jgi:hypothetical protein
MPAAELKFRDDCKLQWVAGASLRNGRSGQKAARASENYYLVFYKPQDCHPDGKFWEITVKIMRGDCAVTYCAGYFAN